MNSRRTVVGVMVLAAAAVGEAPAQTGCATPNCSQSALPECQNQAGPRTTIVEMVGTSTFSPNDPKLEPGDCIEWRQTAALAIHTSTGSGDPTICTDTTCPQDLCESPDCEWDTGNMAGGANAQCHYDAALFLENTVEAFCCRFHFVLGMTGTARFTSKIDVALSKVGGDVQLSWTGGGVIGDETFKVERSDERTFAAPLTRDPDGGAAGRILTDAGENDPARPSRYYLVRNRQSGEL